MERLSRSIWAHLHTQGAAQHVYVHSTPLAFTDGREDFITQALPPYPNLALEEILMALPDFRDSYRVQTTHTSTHGLTMCLNMDRPLNVLGDLNRSICELVLGRFSG
ncbi:hypothetical protein FE257_006162 [Aspergillus nanangensis]|uniref:Uncharacterized protein n=1 Tax=Aspergillus nanangensis TaxID=2582783 RepID=A0AAD4CPE3_ASPNN|nr:hypothetical protein FE257_006162 [Aspergillus nanangensis]